ncbi:MAG: nSTAND1 domain-containing NTPase, partial [Gammaproteobacteria bacterium]
MSENTPSSPFAYDVFLSYSRIDPKVKAAAAMLETVLKQSNLRVFKDDHSIHAGEGWITKLQEALNACGAFMVLIGPEGVWRWVGAEVQVALNRHFGPHRDDERLPLFPILMEGARVESLPPFLALFQATRWSPEQGLPEDLIAAIRGRAIRLESAKKVEGCPFRGLDAFTQCEQDVKLFFGRRMETLLALEKLGDQRQANPERMSNAGGEKYVRWLQIEGNSGAGKSSLVRAGMLPMIEKGALWARTGFEHWRILGPMMPGERPLTKLAEVIERGLIEDETRRNLAKRLEELKQGDHALALALRAFKKDNCAFLLVIDQFEELFTFSEDAERMQFDAVLAGALKDSECPLFLINTVRLDFLDRIERLPRLLTVYNQGVGDRYILPTISEQGLREIIEGPARLAGLDVNEVTTAILDDARNEAGALPLVENALSTLWQKMEPDSHKLSGKLYSELGGLAGILANQADALLTRIDRVVSGGRRKALELLLRLTRINDEGRHSRQRVPLEEGIDVAGEGDERAGGRIMRLLSGERNEERPIDDRPAGSLRLITVCEEGPGAEHRPETVAATRPVRVDVPKTRYVDLIHETLIRARNRDEKTGKHLGYWPTLYNYIEANRGRDILRQQLKFQAEQWKRSKGLGRWWHLAGWWSLRQFRRLRVGKDSLEGRFLFWSRSVFRTQALVALAVLGLFGQAVVWVNQNEKLPFGYAFYQPLWLLGLYQPLPEMVDIPAGKFEMGCKAERDLISEMSECPESELPAHRVDFKHPFQMGKYEV